MCRAVHSDRACVDPQNSRAKAANLIHLVTNENDRAARLGDFPHLTQALLLELQVADSKNLID